MYPHKRKRTGDEQPEPHWLAPHTVEGDSEIPQSFCIDAHEADLVIGKEALALKLEAPETSGQSTRSTLTTADAPDTTRASGLIKLNGGGPDGCDVWIDRCVDIYATRHSCTLYDITARGTAS